jgi:hypothetical protein
MVRVEVTFTLCCHPRAHWPGASDEHAGPEEIACMCERIP